MTLDRHQQKALDHYIRFAAKPAWLDEVRRSVKELAAECPEYWGWLPQAVAEGLQRLKEVAHA